MLSVLPNKRRNEYGDGDSFSLAFLSWVLGPHGGRARIKHHSYTMLVWTENMG